MNIHSRYASAISTQEYTEKPAIFGVEIIPLKWQSDDGGNFTEIIKVTDGEAEDTKESFPIRQASMSLLTPGTIKAYHLHYEQDDLWYVPPTERLLVNLHDVRNDSLTFDKHMRLAMGAGKNFLLRIPRGVAHGVANKYDRTMTLFYFTTQQFNVKKPDEQRIAWDFFGSQVWEITKG